MIRRPPRSTRVRSSAASDVYKRQGRSEVASIWATDEIWLRVPETIKVNIEGEIPPGIYPKDIILHIIGDLGADGALYKAVEFSGKVIREMDIGGRMTLCN